MRSFHGSILRGLPRIDEVVNDSIGRTKLIKNVKCFDCRVGTLVGAEIVVGERRVVVGLDTGDRT